MSALGRFTVHGGPELEGLMSRLCGEVAATASRVVPHDALKALVMIGGYGRGEGGVDTRAGGERPHNNVDLLLITRGGQAPDGWRSQLQQALEPIERRYGIGLDLGAIAARTLRWAPPRIIWYDMRFGHKTIAGDPTFVPSLRRFRTERLLPCDARDLLINRGTLLLLNDALLAAGPRTKEHRSTLFRHAAKAVIGYGDALLFFLGQYHWSYQEKRRRLLAREDVAPRFRRLYAEAAAYRMSPGGDLFGGQDAAEWVRSARPLLAEVHLRCEAERLDRPDLGWDDYPESALRHAARNGVVQPRALARAARGRTPRLEPPRGLSALASLGWRLASARDRLSLHFAAVAYRSASGGARRHDAAVSAYLRAWGAIADSNFDATLGRLGLDLEATAEAA